MAWKVEWTQNTWDDLEIIANFISRDSPYYAAAFVQEVKEAASSLKNFAERGRITPELHRKDIRELFIRHYRLIYQITPIRCLAPCGVIISNNRENEAAKVLSRKYRVLHPTDMPIQKPSRLLGIYLIFLKHHLG